MNLIKRYYIKSRNKIILWNNQRRGFIKFSFTNKFLPKLVVHEKYEKIIKITLRLLAVIGIVTSVFSLPWYLSLALSFIVSLIEQIFEKIIFVFTTLFIQPFPKYHPEGWLGVLFEIEPEKKYYKLNMVFEDENYGKDLFDCIKSWNYNNELDTENNINISFIIENNREYSIYLYPSFERDVIKLARERSEKEALEKKQFKEHQQFIMSIIICKIFPNPLNSNFRIFQSFYKNGDSFEFSACTIKSKIDEIETRDKIKKYEFSEIKGIKPILKKHLKIKKRSELTAKDIEYHHGRLILNK